MSWTMLWGGQSTVINQIKNSRHPARQFLKKILNNRLLSSEKRDRRQNVPWQYHNSFTVEIQRFFIQRSTLVETCCGECESIVQHYGILSHTSVIQQCCPVSTTSTSKVRDKWKKEKHRHIGRSVSPVISTFMSLFPKKYTSTESIFEFSHTKRIISRVESNNTVHCETMTYIRKVRDKREKKIHKHIGRSVIHSNINFCEPFPQEILKYEADFFFFPH